MSRTVRSILIAAAAVAAFCAGAVVDKFVLQRPQPRVTEREAPPPDFALLRQAWDIIDREYVDRPALRAGPPHRGSDFGNDRRAGRHRTQRLAHAANGTGGALFHAGGVRRRRS